MLFYFHKNSIRNLAMLALFIRKQPIHLFRMIEEENKIKLCQIVKIEFQKLSSNKKIFFIIASKKSNFYIIILISDACKK